MFSIASSFIQTHIYKHTKSLDKRLCSTGSAWHGMVRHGRCVDNSMGRAHCTVVVLVFRFIRANFRLISLSFTSSSAAMAASYRAQQQHEPANTQQVVITFHISVCVCVVWMLCQRYDMPCLQHPSLFVRTPMPSVCVCLLTHTFFSSHFFFSFGLSYGNNSSSSSGNSGGDSSR